MTDLAYLSPIQMTPNIGQGANTAMEDAAILASLLNRMLKSDSSTNSPESGDIQKLLQEFQALRYNRVKDVCQRSWFGARLHTRDDFLKAFIGRYIFPYISGNLVTARTSVAIAGGELIDYLPSPKRSGVGWEKYAANGQSKAYHRQWSLFCVSSFFICSLFYLFRTSLPPALPIVV
jgi:FAD dependent monooxygenase